MNSNLVSALAFCAAGLALPGAAAHAQTYSVIHQFTGGADGATPAGGVTVDRDGTLYSTTSRGGSNGDYGTVFKSDPAGNVTELHGFNGTDGSTSAYGSLTLVGHTLYGGTYGGGTNFCGVLYSLGTDGTAFTVLHRFTGPDGCGPQGALQHIPGHGLVGIAGAGGEFYTADKKGNGVLFAVTKFGDYRRLHNFQNTNDGQGPDALVSDGTGSVYGSTGGGGNACAQERSGCGTIFKYDLNTDHYSILYQFSGGLDGYSPHLGSIGPDGTLYGTTYSGTGVARHGTLFALKPAAGAYALTTLADFPLSLGNPMSGPTLSKQGQLVGVTYDGLYVYNNGTRRLLQLFHTDATGIAAVGQPGIGPGGTIYGTAESGGIDPCVITRIGGGCGVLYRYTVN